VGGGGCGEGAGGGRRVREERDGGLKMAGSFCRWGHRTRRSLASATRVSCAQSRGDRSRGAGGAGCASAVGRSQDRPLPRSCGARCSSGVDGARHPAAAGTRLAAGRHARAALSTVREGSAPNLLWQMDFKGHMPLGDGTSCHPLTMIDDHSRFALCLAACANEQGTTVKTHLETAFRRYGLPEAVFVDNGGPWGFTLCEPRDKARVLA